MYSITHFSLHVNMFINFKHATNIYNLILSYKFLIDFIFSILEQVYLFKLKLAILQIKTIYSFLPILILSNNISILINLH